MNGGTFTPGKEKDRAGIYFNFKTTAEERVSVGERGTVALPVVMSWGSRNHSYRFPALKI
ncbi:hypothetical protein RSC2_04166 [Bacillus paralicheniformis]|nr:hypothetical protein RSC1_02299 [Bacillus paralicheniformis]BCE12370.1 hypothetical protein RSC2_04166 [Bacillus paralicheniformis]